MSVEQFPLPLVQEFCVWNYSLQLIRSELDTNLPLYGNP